MHREGGGSMSYLNDNFTFQQSTHKTSLQELKVRTKLANLKHCHRSEEIRPSLV